MNFVNDEYETLKDDREAEKRFLEGIEKMQKNNQDKNSIINHDKFRKQIRADIEKEKKDRTTDDFSHPNPDLPGYILPF